MLAERFGTPEPVIVRQIGKSTIALNATVDLRPQDGRLYRFDANGKPVR